MNKRRVMIGTNALDEAVKLYRKMIPIATIVKVLEIDKVMHYKTAFNIIKADRDQQHHITRPEWLEPDPIVQEAPLGWKLVGGIQVKGKWEYNIH